MQQLKRAFLLYLVLTVLTGILYPLVVTLIAQSAFPAQANGSLIVRDGRVVGSKLIGQTFVDPGYFWARPSATQPGPYNAMASGASNLGPTNPALFEAVRNRVQALRAADPGIVQPVPNDLATASASGLDPHISPEAAEYQVARVARARGVPPDEVRVLVARHTKGSASGLVGQRVVNVLELNLDLDEHLRNQKAVGSGPQSK